MASTSRIRLFLLTLSIAAFASLFSATHAQVDLCATASDLFINAGGANVPGNYRCDASGPWASSNNEAYTVPRLVDSIATGCLDQYKTTAWAETGDLVYTIPVPAGSYKVSLMFTEPVSSFGPGKRQFTITVGNTQLINANGNIFDLVVLAGGADKPYLVSTTASPIDGNIVITLGRVAGANNPTISAIAVQGAGANTLVGSTGLTSCAKGTITTPPVNPPAPPAGPTAVNKCPTANTGDIFINAGGNFNTDGYRCDVQGLWTPELYKYSNGRAVILPTGVTGGCTDHYKSHRSTFAGDIVYTIPVPSGTYGVDLMFMENYAPNVANSRKFTIAVNGVALSAGASNEFDIFTLAGGTDKPYVTSTTASPNAAGNIVITIGRVANADNPMISGIIISGTGANSVIGGSGSGNCIAATPIPSPPGGGTPTSPAPAPPSPPPVTPPAPVVRVDGQVDSCPAAGSTNLFINAGGLFTANGYRCDVAGLWRPGTAKYATTRPVNTTATGCTDQYQSHAYVSLGNLVYTIPVPAGDYQVDLMFMENYAPHTVGSRKFSVTVNSASLSPTGTTGTEFDIVALTGGTDIPYVVSANTTATAAGITITIGRLPGGNNPFLSGIVISGGNATGSVGTSGAGNCVEDTGTTNPVDPGTGGPVGPPTEPTVNTGEGKCPGTDDVFINAGGENIAGGIRCDITNKWASPNKKNYAIPRAVDTTVQGGCFEQYKTSAWTQTGDLVYTVPVPAGDYTVYLGFLEVVPNAFKGFRLFTININNQAVLVEGNANVDIFDLSGGVDKPYLVMHNTTAVGANANIKVTLGRTNKNNPFLSFLNIVGTEAASKVGTIGLQSCLTTEPVPECPTGALPPPVSDFGQAHTAHAVTGGPYIATDFTSAGKVKVELNALQSHSHGTLNSGAVAITDWIWSWTDPTNPIADPTTGKVLLVGPTPAPEFPVGNTPITLEVRDQKCDRALDTTTVTINPARKAGAFCYFYDFIDSESEMVPIENDIATGKLPSYATQVGDINFGNAAAFNSVPFSANSYAVRCVFSIESPAVETLNYKVSHSGPIKVFTDGVEVASSTSYVPGTTTNIPAKTFSAGIHQWQILYFRPKTLTGQLKFLLANNALVPTSKYGYDASKVLPVITGTSKTTAAKGSIIKIFGSGFFNGVVVTFGVVPGATSEVTAKEISVEVPAQEAGVGSVLVTVTTNAGVSNDFTFQYPTVVQPCQTVNWVTAQVKAKTGTGPYVKPNIIVVKYGPDGRLYAGTSQDSVWVMELNKDLKVTFDCEKKLNSGIQRFVVGITFNPASLALKVYMTTATIYWKGKFQNDIQGWTNGKLQSVTAKPNGCFNNDVTDIVTGLPVTNHDHTPSWMQFLPDGRLIISIGGFTNGGISEPNDKLGGIEPNPYSGAIITCPTNKLTAITYTNPETPAQAKVIGTGGCSIYAPGFRNSFGGFLTTRGDLLATDNGPNPTYGDFSTDCNGGKVVGTWFADLLHKVQEGKCHGHPHIPRALEANDPKQCVFRSTQCVQPLWNGVPPSTNGITEYRSNLFDGVFKGNIFLSKFSNAGASTGAMHRVIIDENTGNIQNGGIFKNWHGDSGLSLVEGPRGELIMNRYQKQTFYVRAPVCVPVPPQMYLIGVHPKRGPAAGGHKVLITGFKFGTNPMAKFGAAECTNVQVIDDTQFTCVTPAGTPNTQVKVEIIGPGGITNSITKGTDYWYW